MMLATLTLAAVLAADDVRPVLTQHCLNCHGGQQVKGNFDLRHYPDDEAFRADHDLLERLLDSVAQGDMPPKTAPALPLAERQRIESWAEGLLHHLSDAGRDDPGTLTMPRLTSADFDRVMSDLAGVPIDDDGILPREGGAGEGFANVGEAQAMTAVHAEAFLAAIDHAFRQLTVGAVSGLRWSARPLMTASDRRQQLADRWMDLHARVEERLIPRDAAALGRLIAATAAAQPPADLPTPVVQAMATWLTTEHPAGTIAAQVVARARSGDASGAGAALEHLLRRPGPPKRKDGKRVPPTDDAQHDARMRSQVSPRDYRAERKGAQLMLRTFLATVPGDPVAELTLPQTWSDATGPLRPRPIDLEPWWNPAERAEREAIRADWAAEIAPGWNEERLTAAMRAAIVPFATRAWRRSPTPQESERILALATAQRQAGASVDQAVKQALKAVLLSPAFLFRVQSGGDRPLAPRELADRLAFALWGSLPDAELLAAADHGDLADAAGIARQATRLLAHPRRRTLVTDFLGQWLDFSAFASHSGPVQDLYPAWKPSLRQAMYDEVVLFCDRILGEDRPITELLDADWTFANEELAKLYGIPGVTGQDMRLVQLQQPDRTRGGIVTMAAILTRTSRPERSSPVLRGTWILTSLLAQSMPEPPANVPPLSQQDTDAQGRSIPQQLAVHRANPACAACHDRIDPPGLALEHFDAIGAWRDRYQGGGAITAGSIADAAALRAWLRSEQPRFVAAFTRKLTGYLLGRAVVPGDRELLERQQRLLAENGMRPSAAIIAILTSTQFRERRD
jgi:hypothetical protein